MNPLKLMVAAWATTIPLSASAVSITHTITYPAGPDIAKVNLWAYPEGASTIGGIYGRLVYDSTKAILMGGDIGRNLLTSNGVPLDTNPFCTDRGIIDVWSYRPPGDPEIIDIWNTPFTIDQEAAASVFYLYLLDPSLSLTLSWDPGYESRFSFFGESLVGHDIQIGQVPEPSTSILVIAGLIGLAGWRRVRA